MAKIPQGNINKLTAVQRKALQLAASQPHTGQTNQEIADELGISLRTLYRYKADENFKACLIGKSVDAGAEYVPQIIEVIAKKALKGDSKSLEYFCKIYGLFSETKVIEQTTDISKESVLDEIRQMAEDLANLGVKTTAFDDYMKDEEKIRRVK